MMFHVEQETIRNWFREKKHDPDQELTAALSTYVSMIHSAGERFNLTGFKSSRDIALRLVLSSLEPLSGLNVPRGTKFIDVGSGAGIPGIPLSLFFPHLSGFLLESNIRKSHFIGTVIEKLKISNCAVINARAEEIAHSPFHREKYSLAFSRALADPYVSAELSVPFLGTGGAFYFFSHDSEGDTEYGDRFSNHLYNLGAIPAGAGERASLGFSEKGLLFIKKHSTPESYPRRFSAIKRESKKAFSTT